MINALISRRKLFKLNTVLMQAKQSKAKVISHIARMIFFVVN